MKRLKILNDNHYNSFEGMILESAYKHKPNEWHCETDSGFMVVRATAAVISIGFSETEDSRFDEMCIVGGAIDKKDKLIMSSIYSAPYCTIVNNIINFREIADFMKWEINDNKIWDG